MRRLGGQTREWMDIVSGRSLSMQMSRKLLVSQAKQHQMRPTRSKRLPKNPTELLRRLGLRRASQRWIIGPRSNVRANIRSAPPHPNGSCAMLATLTMTSLSNLSCTHRSPPDSHSNVEFRFWGRRQTVNQAAAIYRKLALIRH
jgi:hypothetical protein